VISISRAGQRQSNDIRSWLGIDRLEISAACLRDTA
jgi:hypothetical protein